MSRLRNVYHNVLTQSAVLHYLRTSKADEVHILIPHDIISLSRKLGGRRVESE